MKKSTEELSLLTEQEIVSIAERCGLLTFVSDAGYGNDALWFDADCTDFARAIESTVIEKIKAQGAVAWLHEQRLESDVVTTAVKQVWGKVPTGNLAAYSVPLYRLPEGD